MGLALEVGMLADLLENDEEAAQWFQEDFDKDSPESCEVPLLQLNEREWVFPEDQGAEVG